MYPADFWLFAGSLAGLLLAPAALGRAVWAVPAAFAAVGLFLLFAPPELHPSQHPWVALALLAGPPILLGLDLLAGGRIAARIPRVPVRALVAASLFRFLGIRHLHSALSGELPARFALETAASELVVAAGALLIWATYGRAGRWRRPLLMGWNAFALASSLSLGFRVFNSHPMLPLPIPASSPYIHAHFTAWPGSLEAFFWVPAAVCLHMVLFYSLFQEGRAGAFRQS